jgi:ABC-type multidrug transport system ATPase subunit
LIYSNADIQIFDDPLSALDAHVGKKVFEDVLKGGLKGRTRILVTHALHFLSMVDYVFVLEEGKIREQGKFEDLMANGGAFAKFVNEFGSSQDKQDQEPEKVESKEKDDEDSQKNASAGQAIMQVEERNVGAVTWDIYKVYLKAAKGELVVPFLLFSLLLMQGSNIVGSYWLVWWQERSVEPFSLLSSFSSFLLC